MDDLAGGQDDGLGDIAWTELDDPELQRAFLAEYERAFGHPPAAPDALHAATAPGQVRLTLGSNTFTVDWNGAAEQRREIVLGFAWALLDMHTG